jgi:hypothetical protein
MSGSVSAPVQKIETLADPEGQYVPLQVIVLFSFLPASFQLPSSVFPASFPPFPTMQVPIYSNYRGYIGYIAIDSSCTSYTFNASNTTIDSDHTRQCVPETTLNEILYGLFCDRNDFPEANLPISEVFEAAAANKEISMEIYENGSILYSD